MKIKFIIPSHPSAKVKLFGKVYMSPLTPAILASLTPPDFDFIVCDENIEPINFNEPIDLVAISVLTPMAKRAYEIADEFRKRGVKVVLGGVHPTLMPDEAISHADAIVIGEAEGIWEKLLKDFREGNLKKRYFNDKKPTLENLSLPKWDVLKKEAYVNIPKVETSRGCPFNCIFCSTTKFFGNRIRYRPVKEVVNEIKALGERFVFFTDNNIVGNPSYARELFKSLIPLKIKWIGQGSLNIAKHFEVLKLMARSGCVGLLIGFESLGEKALKEMRKKVNVLIKYKEAIERIHSLGIGIIGCFVFGFDNDDENVFKKTVNFIRKTRIEVPQFTLLTPFPGTALREKLEREKRILHNFWEKYDVVHLVFTPKFKSGEDLREGYDYACQKVYSYWSIFWRMIKAFPHLRSLYKFLVFWQINVVYRRLYLTSLSDDANF